MTRQTLAYSEVPVGKDLLHVIRTLGEIQLLEVRLSAESSDSDMVILGTI